MALGLYGRIRPEGLIGEPDGDPNGDNPERVTVIHAYNGIAGVELGMWSSTGLVNALNRLLDSNQAQHLRAEDETDLTNILTELTAQPNNTAKLIYIHKVQSVFVATSLGELTETQFRNLLNIA